MPKNSFIPRIACFLVLLVAVASSHATDTGVLSGERSSQAITDSESPSESDFGASSVAETALDDRVDDPVPEDVNLFHIPLIGEIENFGFRMATADSGKFDGLRQQAFFVDFKLPWEWSPWPNITASPKLALEVGRFNQGSEDRFFASLGPTLRLANDRWRVPLFMDLGLSPTIIDGSSYGDRDFGTSFNFTSHIGFGLRFGQKRNHLVKLRYQHISNGSIDEVNPGVNMIGVDVVLWAR